MVRSDKKMYVCMYVCMYGWMDGWMDACMHACMHVWMDGWMDGWMDRCMDGCAMQDKNETKLCGKILQNDYFDSHSNQNNRFHK